MTNEKRNPTRKAPKKMRRVLAVQARPGTTPVTRWAGRSETSITFEDDGKTIDIRKFCAPTAGSVEGGRLTAKYYVIYSERPEEGYSLALPNLHLLSGSALIARNDQRDLTAKDLEALRALTVNKESLAMAIAVGPI